MLVRIYNSVVACFKASSQGSQGRDALPSANNSSAFSPGRIERLRLLEAKQREADLEHQRKKDQVHPSIAPTFLVLLPPSFVIFGEVVIADC